MADISVNATGHRITDLAAKVTENGDHIVLTFGVEDRKTKEKLASFRAFTGFAGLGVLTVRLMAAAAEASSALLRRGKIDLVESYSPVHVLAARDCAALVSADREKVVLQIATEPGPAIQYALLPKQALALADQLSAAAAEAGRS